jgi:hypothetical protein
VLRTAQVRQKIFPNIGRRRDLNFLALASSFSFSNSAIRPLASANCSS